MHILCKNPIQLDTLAVVRFLFHEYCFDARPAFCIERCHPEWATELPAIKDGDSVYVGLDACIKYYEKISGACDLASKAFGFDAPINHK